MDWRQSPWLKPNDGLSESQRARQEAALGVLEEHRRSGTPFLLFLRTFAIRQLYCHASDGGDGGDGILMEVHFQQELAKFGAKVLVVQNLGSGALDLVWARGTPGLALRDETWFEAVKHLIASAELIVSECQGLTPAVSSELRACVDAGKADRTVLILPSHPFEFVGNEEAVAAFPRVIQQFDMNLARPSQSFVFRDLMDRMGRGAAMPPVSYDGVAEGFAGLARKYTAEKNPNAALFYGMRGVQVSQATGGLAAATESRLALAEMCRQAGNAKLGLVLIDEAEKKIAEAGFADLVEKAREDRSKMLGEIFEGLMKRETAEELERLARSQAGYSVSRGDARNLAQCLSWMAVAACLLEDFEQAIEHARDAVSIARSRQDADREAFASYYLGSAHKALGQKREAMDAFLRAVQLLPLNKFGHIHAAAMLSLALTLEELGGAPEGLMDVFRSAKTLADGLARPDLAEAAEAGIRRIEAHKPNN